MKKLYTTLAIALLSISGFAQSTVGCGCLAVIDSTFSVAPICQGNNPCTPPEYRNDDGFTDTLALPFTFCFYGTNYNHVYINNNGNLTFEVPNGNFTSLSFPNNQNIMIAPFWADVDTRNPSLNGPPSGLVWYKIMPNYMIVQWKQVGYFQQNTDKVNTFQVIISDGSASILPAGINVAFCYGDMHWTTGVVSFGGVGSVPPANGFGGMPATVGINRGDGINYIQIGRFDHAGTSYDGAYGSNDGVNFLRNQSFYFNVCATANIPPIANGLSNCDTLKICGLGDTICLDQSFYSGEQGQNTTIAINLNGVPGAVITANNSGNIANSTVCIYTSQANAGNNVITFTATDNGTPPQSTTVNLTFFVDTTAPPVPAPIISGTLQFCAGATSVLSVAPISNYSYLWSTGSSDTSITVFALGDYSVTANLNGCYKSSSVHVIEHPLPTPAILGNPFVCAGDTTTMLYGDSLIYNSYSWNTGSTSDTVFVGTGTYVLTVTDNNGCSNYADSPWIQTPQTATTIINSTIYSLNYLGNYQWVDCNNSYLAIPGATYEYFIPPTLGSYAVITASGTCIDTSACVNFSCLAGYTTAYDTLFNTFILTIDSVSSYVAASYHWDFGDGTSSTLANPSHVYTVDTLYNVCMTIYTATGDSCQYCHYIGKDYLGNIYRNNGFTVNVYNHSNVLVPTVVKETTITIAPNPFTSATTISFSSEQKNTIIRVTDVLGKEIKTLALSGARSITLEKGEMQPGIYFVQITTDTKTVVNRKIVVQ